LDWSLGQKPLSSSQLAELMQLYEQNYVQMRMLVPELQQLQRSELWSRVEECLDLRLVINETSPYTTTVNLSYVFDNDTGPRIAPDLEVRVYHDARSAEVMSGLLHGKRFEARRVRSLEGSWRLNRFLYKWLRYCRFRGHSFSEVDAAVTHAGRPIK